MRITLATRAEQRSRLRRFQDAPRLEHVRGVTVCAQRSGYITDIDLDPLACAIAAAQGEVEIEFCAQLGSHVIFGSELALVRAEHAADRDALAEAVLDALTCGRERKLDREAMYGIHQLASVGWAAGTDQQDPEAALIAVAGLHTLLAHWTQQDPPISAAAQDGDLLPVVYPDTTIREVLSALATILIATGRSGQHHTYTHILDIFAMALPRLTPDHQRIAVDYLHRALPIATTHTLTPELDRSLTALGGVLRDTNFLTCADHLATLQSRLTIQLTELSH